MVYNINPTNKGANPQFFTVYNDRLYFAANDGTHGQELWVYDGVSDPKMVVDIDAGPGSSTPAELTIFDNKLYFSADNPATIGRELYSLFDTSKVPPPSNIGTINTISNINIYPNPASDMLNIQFSLKESQVLSIAIREIQGRMVYESKPVVFGASKHAITIPVRNLPSGNYTYSIKTNDATQSTGKFIKK